MMKGSMMGSCQAMKEQKEKWMGGWVGGGMWIWTVIGVVVVALLVVVISKLSKK